MATESKTEEEKQPTTTTEDTDDEVDQVALLQQMIEQLPSMLSSLVTSDEEIEPPIFKSFDLANAAEYMTKCSNIIVMSGAGISTSAGIPDFRSPGTGLHKARNES